MSHTIQLTPEQCIQAAQTAPQPINSHSPTSIAILWSITHRGTSEDLWTTDAKGRQVIPIQLYNSVEGCYQVENFSCEKAVGLILRGNTHDEHLIGFTNKKVDILIPGGMGPRTHLESVPMTESINPEQLECPNYMESLVEGLRQHVESLSRRENIFLDNRHVSQLGDPSISDYILNTFRPISEKLRGSGITLRPHLLTYGGGSPRTLITMENLLRQLNMGNPNPYLEVIIPEMWGSNFLRYCSQNTENKDALVGSETRGDSVIYYRGQYGDLLQ